MHAWHDREREAKGDRDPVSRTNFNEIHASRFESVIENIEPTCRKRLLTLASVYQQR